MAFQFEGKNPIELNEIMNSFGTNAIDTVVIGIRDDQHDATINRTAAQPDGLVRALVNNGVARSAEIYIDPCKSGKDKYYIQTPYTITDTPVGIDDDGQGCCVGTPSVTACRYKLGIDELCVKDCVATSLDEMMEQEVKQHGSDIRMPWSETGKSIAAKRAKFVAEYAKFIFERNAILGTPEFSGDGMRPFNGLLSRLLDDRVLKMDGSAGVLSSIMALDCRLSAMGQSVGNYIIAINPILMPTLKNEVRTYLKSDPFTEWKLTANGVSYRGMNIITSRYVDVDLEDNTTSIWLIDPSKVGIKFIRDITNPYVKRIDSQEDCGGHCITMHNAGTTVVTNWNGLVLINNVKLGSICDSLALSGLDGFVNAGVIGQRYPKVTANPGM
jgi:hypothetical protein